METDLIIITSVLGGVCILFFILFAILIFIVFQLNRKVNVLENHRKRENNAYAYNNPGIRSGEELSKRGYSIHEGQNQNPLTRNRSTANEPISDIPRVNEHNNYNNRDRDDRDFKDANNDFTNILNNDNIVFGGSGGGQSRLPKSNKGNHLNPINNPSGNQSNNNNNMMGNRNSPYEYNNTGGALHNPGSSLHRHEDRTYFNNRGPNY